MFSDVVVLIGRTSSHFENASTMIKNIFPSKGQHEASTMGIVDIPWESVAKVADYFGFISKDDCFLPYPQCLQLFRPPNMRWPQDDLRGTNSMLTDDLL